MQIICFILAKYSPLNATLKLFVLNLEQYSYLGFALLCLFFLLDSD